MLISVVTLNYNKSNLTIACVESLYNQFKNEFLQDEIELIIVDNASSDNSVKVLSNETSKRKYKNITIITNNENSGFGKGCNIGARAAKGDYLLFLNNDTVVKDKGILEMTNYMSKNSQVSILGGQLKNEDGSNQPSTGKFYTLGRAILLLSGGQKFGVLDKSPKDISKVDWVKGALLMIKKDLFDNLNGFDENIFMYIEDMELCYRAKQKGYDTYFYPDVLVFHAEYGSTNRTFVIINIYKSLLYFYKKHRNILEYSMLKFLLLVKACVLIIIGFLLNNLYLKTTYSQALRAIW